jgi:eukaryotic-like serine/threonine-protein kinase
MKKEHLDSGSDRSTPSSREFADSTPTNDSVTFEASGKTSSDGLREGPGTKIGPYKLLQLIGEGGFGSVFMAEQTAPVQRKVALKIIKLGMDTRQVVARFEQERQALAMMDHPNIARVLDAGATEAGRPFFVMELVKGDPIVEYCDKNNLSITDRLELFAQVCNAVQHAHTKGIIHRDIKPSNILVSTQDGKPSTKVIDFGIAKATSARLTEKTLFTEHRQLIGTPEYMSPEQAEGSMDIDTRTDVYSLGVLMYQLLTGSTPFSSQELRSAAYGEIQKIIREKEPPKPSTRLSQATVTLSEVAAHRQIEPKRLGTVIRGELDWIVMKAMEKDRARRYETANGLAMDIRRYMSGEAVLAAPPGRAYRIQKFVRRHRGAAIATGVVAAALVLGVVGTSIGLLEATRQRRAAVANAATASEQAARASKAEGEAQSRLAEAEATVGFLDDMLGAVDPTAQGKDVSVRAVLDRAAATVGTKFADRPMVAARLHGTIGRTYMGLGAYDKGESHLREQLRIRTSQLGEDHVDTRRALNELGLFLIKNGQHTEAEGLLKRAIVTNERLFGRRHELTVQSLALLAELYVQQTRNDEAEPLLKEVLEVRTSTIGVNNSDTVMTMNSLALLYTDTARFEEAEKTFLEALASQEKLSGPDHPFTLEVRSNLAWMHYWAASQERQSAPERSKQRMQKARQMGEEVLEAKRRVLGEEHQSTLASMGNLASVYLDLGLFDEAEAMKRKDLEVTLRVLGEDHPDTQVSLANLGSMLRRRGKHAEALPYLERAIKGTRKLTPPDSQGLGFTLGWYGSCLAALGRFEEAERSILEGQAIMVKNLGENNPMSMAITKDVIKLYTEWDKADPGKGHAAKESQWKATLDAMAKPKSAAPAEQAGTKPDGGG